MATEETTIERGFGWLRDLPDKRDYRFGPLGAVLAELPDYVDLRAEMPPVYDQGDLGSCAPNAGIACVEHAELKAHDPDARRLSRLHTYWHARAKINATESDSGSHIRDVFQVLAELGAPREQFWPYDIERFREEPPSKWDWSSGHHRAIEYRSIVDTSERDMQACLAEGYPFTFGFAVPRSFLSVPSHGGWQPRPDEPIVGYHAVVAVGYDFSPDAFASWAGGCWIVRNSWSEGWGREGHFLVPRTWLPLEAFDCWTIRRVTR